MQNSFEWIHVWEFFRSFIFGGFAGYVAAKMSLVSADSKRNLVEMEELKEAEDQEALIGIYEQSRKHESRFRNQMIRAYVLVGGISGMIAVNTFNPGANNLQTFAIAAIAGASGFAFLKKNMLVDDQAAEVLLHKQTDDPVISLLNEIVAVVSGNELIDKEPIIPAEEILKDEFIKQEMVEDGLLEDETSSRINIEEFPPKLKTFVESMKDEKALTNQELRYIKSLLDAGKTPEEIIQRF